jgi:hypothetical protein
MKAPMKLQKSPMAQRRLEPDSADSAAGARRAGAASGRGAAGGSGGPGKRGGDDGSPGEASSDPPAVAAGEDKGVPEAEGMEDPTPQG